GLARGGGDPAVVVDSERGEVTVDGERYLLRFAGQLLVEQEAPVVGGDEEAHRRRREQARAHRRTRRDLRAVFREEPDAIVGGERDAGAVHRGERARRRQAVAAAGDVEHAAVVEDEEGARRRGGHGFGDAGDLIERVGLAGAELHEEGLGDRVVL